MPWAFTKYFIYIRTKFHKKPDISNINFILWQENEAHNS